MGALIRAALAREASISTFFTFPYRKVDLISLVFLFSSERATASESQNFSNLLRDISISLFPFQSHFRSVVAVHRAFFSSSFFSFSSVQRPVRPAVQPAVQPPI